MDAFNSRSYIVGMKAISTSWLGWCDNGVLYVLISQDAHFYFMISSIYIFFQLKF